MVPASTNNVALARKTLVGKVCTTRTSNKAVAKDIIYKGWNYPDLHVSDLGKTMFLFSFSSEEHTKEVMRRSPWYVMNHLLSLQLWLPEVSPYELDFNYNSFWIQVHKVPLEYLNCKNVTTILSKVGTVEEVEEPPFEGRLMRTFIRTRVSLDITKPLPTGCWIPRADLPKIWVIYRCERLQDLCLNCGILGHEQKECYNQKVMATYDSRVPKYDLGIVFPAAISIQAVIKEYQ